LVLGLASGKEKKTEPFRMGLAISRFKEKDIRQSAAAGVGSVRVDAIWTSFEKAKAEFAIPPGVSKGEKVAVELAVQPLCVLCYGHSFYQNRSFPTNPASRAAFTRFSRFAVERLPGASTWEIWNEWNLAIGMPHGTRPGAPKDYVHLLADTYSALKTDFPDKIFLGGSMAGIGRSGNWTRRALDAGMLRHLDGLSFHPYVYWMSPRDRVPERGMLSLLSELEALLAQYPKGREVPLYITELGWPTHDAFNGVSLGQQANYLSRALLLLRANSRIKGIWIYTLNDRPGSAADREAHFGLLFPNGSPKPSWYSLKDTVQLLKDAASCRRVDFGSRNDEIAGVELMDRKGRRSLALWTIDEKLRTVRLEFPADSFPQRLPREIIGRGTIAPPPSRKETKAGGQFLVTIGPSPTILKNAGNTWKIVSPQSDKADIPK
jgi:hypothetical protein